MVTGNDAAVDLAAASGTRMAAKTATRTRERRSTNPPSARGSVARRATGLLTRGSLLHRLPRPSGPVAFVVEKRLPLQRRDRPGLAPEFPYRSPVCGARL